jgi:hypothetical protein
LSWFRVCKTAGSSIWSRLILLLILIHIPHREQLVVWNKACSKRLSFIQLVFPPGELGLSDHAWHEAALSTGRPNSEERQAGWRNTLPLTERQYTCHSHQRNLHGYPEHIATWRTKHLHSKMQSRAFREHGPSIKRWNSPNYRKPNIPYNRCHGYSVSSSYCPEAQTQASTPHSVRESINSPSTINVSTPSSSDDSVDILSTPGSVCDQFRSGPFGHIFDGLRLTDQERALLEELAQPDATGSQGQKGRAATTAENVQTLSQTPYSDFISQSSNSGADTGDQINDD